jgi:hypothetical protein
LQFRTHQIFFVSRFAIAEGNSQLSIGQLERAIRDPRTTIHRALKNQWEPPKLRGHHFSLPDAAETQIVASTGRQVEKNQPVTRTDSFHDCVINFGKSMTRGWAYLFLMRHYEELKETPSSPQENSRLEVPRDFLTGLLRCMNDAIQGLVRSRFVLIIFPIRGWRIGLGR